MTGAGTHWYGSLRGAHDKLSQEMNGFRIYLRHGIPDTVLFHYALDVLEQGHAAWILTDSVVARAAIANARAAYEASIYMLALTAIEADYDRNGILARACELVELENLQARRAKADQAMQLPPIPAGRTPEQVMEADGARWETEVPGAKALCLQLLQDVREDKRWKRHWTGDNGWPGVTQRVATSWGTQAGFVEMADALYGAESYQSHPRPRASSRDARWDEQGRLAAAPKESDGPMAAALAHLACTFAQAAVDRRKTFSNALERACPNPAAPA